MLQAVLLQTGDAVQKQQPLSHLFSCCSASAFFSTAYSFKAYDGLSLTSGSPPLMAPLHS